MSENATRRLLTDEQYQSLRQTLNRANGVFLVLGSGFKMDGSYLTYSEDKELMGLHSDQKTLQKETWEQVFNKTKRVQTHPFLLAYPAWMKTSPMPPQMQPVFHVFKSSVMDCVNGVEGANVNLFELNGNIGGGMSPANNMEVKIKSLSDIYSLNPTFPFEKDKYQCRKKTVGKFEMLLEELTVNNIFFLGCTSQSEIHASFFNRSLNKSRHDKLNIVTANTNENNFMLEHSNIGVCCDAKEFLDELHERLMADNPELPDSYMSVCRNLGICE